MDKQLSDVDTLLNQSGWSNMDTVQIKGYLERLHDVLPDIPPENTPLIKGMVLQKQPGKAKMLLGMTLGRDERHDIIMGASQAVAYLKGYDLGAETLGKYVCSQCGKTGTKLWRAIHSAREAWCSACAMAQAGYLDTIDENGRNDEGDFGPSDQIHNSDKGQNLLPWVPAPNGHTWGYSSVPGEGILWWRSLPTR